METALSRKNAYTRHYFECGIETGKSLYSNYRWIPEMTVRMASVMVDYLDIKRGQTVLDIGCAKGFLVKAMRWLGRDCWGYDISDYALQNCDPEIRDYVSKIFPTGHFDFAIAKDVLEHVKTPELIRLLTKMRSNVLFVIVPLGDGKKYNVPAYELDITHVHKQPLIWWNNLLKSTGWSIRSSVPRVPGLKDNWAYEMFSNGFIVAEKSIRR